MMASLGLSIGTWTPTKKHSARLRLGALEEVPHIYPAARRMVKSAAEFTALIERLPTAAPGGPLMDAAIDRYAAELERMNPAAHRRPEGILTEPALADELVAYADAGMFFFEGQGDFAARNLSERRALGGSGTVTRTLRLNDRLLLETTRIIVQFIPGLTAEDRAACLYRHGLISVGRLNERLCIETVAVFDRPAVDAAFELLEDEAVAFAEPDFIERFGKRTLNDPSLIRQWHLANQGQESGTAGADVKALDAWRMATGKGVRIGVIDTGFDTAHADLVLAPESGWFRPTADALDADFVPGISGMLPDEHGTACAGMAAARVGDGTGGLAYDADLVAIACLNDQIGTQTTLGRAIGYAADPRSELAVSGAQGVDVLVCSLGPNVAAWAISQTLRTFIEDVAQQGRNGRGLPIFWACTNGNHPIAADEVCSHENVIAVGRSTRTDSDDGCGFGPKLAFLAPGKDLLLPTRKDNYGIITGTSFAAPCAAGVACLVLEANPELTAREVGQLLQDTCDKVGPIPYVNGRNDRFGHGRLNAARAVEEATARIVGQDPQAQAAEPGIDEEKS